MTEMTLKASIYETGNERTIETEILGALCAFRMSELLLKKFFNFGSLLNLKY